MVVHENILNKTFKVESFLTDKYEMPCKVVTFEYLVRPVWPRSQPGDQGDGPGHPGAGPASDRKKTS